MNGAAYNGHLETVKWLHENRKEVSCGIVNSGAGQVVGGDKVQFTASNRMCLYGVVCEFCGHFLEESAVNNKLNLDC